MIRTAEQQTNSRDTWSAQLRAPSPVLLLDRARVSQSLTLDECIAVIEPAFAAHTDTRVLAPALLHVQADGGEFHLKAGGTREPRTYFACKINGGFFNNRVRHGLPNILGLILLYNGATGEPLAIIESGLITLLRTGAATAIAAKYLARPDSKIVTICGAGQQAAIQLRALSRVLPLQRAFIWNRRSAAAVAQALSAELKFEVLPASDIATATHVSDVIVTCTPSKSWLVGREHVRPGTFVAAVGADSPDKQEIEPGLLASSSVVCDLVAQCVRVGDLHHAVAGGLMTASEIRGELGDVIAGKVPARLRDDEIIVFDSTGTAIQDVAAAATAYEHAVSSARGTQFAFWT